MPADDLTPGQVAELLQVDASTLRRWARAFAGHLSPQAHGKRRRYSSGDLGVLTRARDLLRSGKSPREVGELLATVPAEPLTVPAVAAVSLPGLASDLIAAQEALRVTLGRLEALEGIQDAQAARIAALDAQIEAWRALSWWRRMFGRPPG
jgi:DNA-binding transcriptional MerR regulator